MCQHCVIKKQARAQARFLRLFKNRLYNSSLKIFCRVGTLPEYDTSGNTDTAHPESSNRPNLRASGSQGVRATDAAKCTNPGHGANKKVRSVPAR
jgi:hypothetical protein